MKVVILGNFSDGQTGLYILDAFKKFSSDIIGIDTRRMINDVGPEETQKLIIPEILESMKRPDLIIVMKGLELTLETLKNIKKEFPKAKIVNWFFDKYLGEDPIWENKSYFETLKFYDVFFCSLKGVADRLTADGFKNVRYLDEGCHPDFHGPVYMNHYQKQKYGSDVVFIGSLGYLKQHKNRIPILEHIAKEEFDLSIWGEIVCETKHIPKVLKSKLKGCSVINDTHSMVCQSSLINLGIDQDLDIDMGFSARLYRVLCAGGMYLSTATRGTFEAFKINNTIDKPITGEEDFVVFYNEQDLIKKIDFLLEYEDIRKKIAENGRQTVLKNHTFEHRLREMLKVIKEVK